MPEIFSRPDLAARMAQQLLSPGVLDEGLRSGLFLSGPRRTGKTTFVVHDLTPALEARGALVIYTDLWTDVAVSPAQLIHSAIRQVLESLQSPIPGVLGRLKHLQGAEIGVLGFKFGFKIDQIGRAGGPTLATVLTEVVDQAKTDVILIVDEVQQAMMTDEGNTALLALKAARDAINTRPKTPGHFILIGTGSHRALVNELTTKRTQAFAGATSVSYPVLDDRYVDYLLRRLADEGASALPSFEVAVEAFKTLGSRPEEMIKAFRLMNSHVAALQAEPDTALPIVAATLRTTTADIELAKVEDMGALARAVFDRIASENDAARGLFAGDALADYARAVDREVRADEVQSVVNALLQANLVLRSGHGLYGVSDPFVGEIWRERKQLLGSR